MNIAHVCATYPPYQGGTGRVCQEQCRGLVARGHEVTVYTVTDRGSTVYELSVGEPFVVRYATILRFGNAALPLDQLWCKRHDLFHFHYPYYGGGDFAWVRALVGRIPYVVTYHQDVKLQGALNAIAKAHHATAGRFLLAGARTVMATTVDYAQHSKLRPLLWRSGVPRVIAIPHGVDMERFSPGPGQDAARAALGWNRTDRVVLFVGALDTAHYFKGVPVLLEALARLNGETVRGVIVGHGDLLPQLRERARHLGLAERVVFATDVDDQELPLYYRGSDVTVLPSLTQGEAFGVVLLESLACGTPVVASDIPGVRSVVRDTGGGMLVPAGDVEALAKRLGQLLSEESLRLEMRKRGLARVRECYTWSHVLDRLEMVYQDVLAGEYD
ncbi:MAG: glycosyltransferase family 4 protein [Chloroflexi bacterium]|nr:glycosyltransferase family 4 protein [Chloroflexota bacterium]